MSHWGGTMRGDHNATPSSASQDHWYRCAPVADTMPHWAWLHSSGGMAARLYNSEGYGEDRMCGMERAHLCEDVARGPRGDGHHLQHGQQPSPAAGSVAITCSRVSGHHICYHGAYNACTQRSPARGALVGAVEGTNAESYSPTHATDSTITPPMPQNQPSPHPCHSSCTLPTHVIRAAPSPWTHLYVKDPPVCASCGPLCACCALHTPCMHTPWVLLH